MSPWARRSGYRRVFDGAEGVFSPCDATSRPAACGNDSDNGLSRFAGRPLEIDAEIYASQAATNLRNRGIAKLLEGYGRMYFDALEATDVYTRACSLKVARRRLKDARRSQRT